MAYFGFLVQMSTLSNSFRSVWDAEFCADIGKTVSNMANTNQFLTVKKFFADTFFIFFIVMLLNFKLSIHALTNKKSCRSSSFYQTCQQIFYTLVLTM